MTSKIRVDGKFFALGDARFPFRGVTYGTFEPDNSNGTRFPDRDRIKHDFDAMNAASFTVVRTYTTPNDDVLELAADWDLRVLAGVFFPDWRYLLGASRREFRHVARAAREEVRRVARQLAGNENVLGLTLGNEIPADVLRWYGSDAVAGVIRDLVDVVRSEDPQQLITYANYPTAEYLPLEELDFLTFNVFLEREGDFRRYLTRLHHIAGDRPLVIGELGLDSGTDRAGERRQRETLDWQLATAMERGVAGTCVFSWTDDWWVGDHRVEDWHFGLTRADRTPKPALAVAAEWNSRTVRDLDVDWPSMSVVICAYNAAATLDECLGHTCALDYPDLEIIVVDDGSTDATATIVSAHPRARLLQVPHGGLAVARNAGFTHASGDLIAYLDADAYPPPEWPYYLALGLDGPKVGGVGGPNIGPPSDCRAARVVAAAPGGPVHVLLSDHEAEHVPGCNMAFWKDVLLEVGGFDPVFDAAGDDVDLCWRVLDRDWTIGFHPAALVWHHRRPGLRPYLRQQRGYGRSETLVEARHPDRFSPLGAAKWRGRIYQTAPVRPSAQRIYRGAYGAAAYQSVYGSGGHLGDLVHQAGVPLLTLALLTLPLALVQPWFAAPALAAAAALAALALFDARRAAVSRAAITRPWAFGLRVAAHQILQPIVRAWARRRARHHALRHCEPAAALPAVVPSGAKGVTMFVEDRPRADLVVSLSGHLRQRGLRSLSVSGWEDHDGVFLLSPLVNGELLTSSHPVGYVQARMRPRMRLIRVVGATSVAAALAFVTPVASVVAVTFVLAMLTRGVAQSRTVLAATAAPRPA